MKKRSSIIILALLLVLCLVAVFAFAACDDGDDQPPAQQGGGNGGTQTPEGGTQTPEGGTQTPEGGTQTPDGGDELPDDGDEPQKQNFSGILFESKTYDFDGSEKTLTLSGAALPTGASVQYTNNKGTDVGTYNATAVITCEGYNTLTLTAKLVINKINFSGLALENKTVDYNGSKHTVSLTGTVPAGAVVTYTGGEDGKNGLTNAGSRTVTVTVTHKNYNTFTDTATLTVKPISFGSAFSFEGESFEYDTEKHVITMTGNVPNGATVTYTGGEDGKNGATNVGSYTITVTVTHKNYITYTATAVLKITSKEEALSVAFLGSKVYFQNALDSKYLYTYAGGSLSYVNRDTPSSMITAGGKIYYLSKGLLSSGIFSLDPSTGKAECLYEVKGDTLVTDGTYLYYNVNLLVGGADKNGIWRIAIADLENGDVEATPRRLTSVKSGDMVVTDGYVYFANKADGGKLYAVSTNASNATPTKIYDYKISDIITDGQKLYFTREMTLSNFSLGAAIYSINVDGGLHALVDDDSSKVVKITMSRGKYLTLIGDYIYFVNTDMATTRMYGDGIYRAKKDGSGWLGDALTLLIGSSKVVDGENDNIYGLTSDGSALYYYRANDKHLHRYNISTETETDLMQGFVPPERTELITTTNEKTQLYDGEIYYINMLDGGKLYKYNLTTKLDMRITNLSVADFAVHDGVLYYATVRLMVNYDLYRMSLTTGVPELLSTEKCLNFSFANGKMYYNNFSGDNDFCCMDLSTLEVTVLHNKKVTDNETCVVGDYVYFIVDEKFYRYSPTDGTAAMLTDEVTTLEYLIHDGKILLMNTTGFQNSIAIYDIEADKVTKLGNIGISGISDDLRGMFVYNGEFYFYRDVTAGSSNKGLYRVKESGGSYTVELVDKLEGYYMCESIVIGNKVYFMDVWQVKGSVPTPSSSAKLCVLDLTTMQVSELN